MPDYVYALHDFVPEHEDEIGFHAGERIEVVEKDDLYGDGWWQGRNLTGKVGLFPQSYTAPAPPTAEALTHTASSSSATSDVTVTDPGPKQVLQPLDEESESDSPTDHNSNIAAPVPKAPAILYSENEPTNGAGVGHQRVVSNGDGEVMKATMTDVQKAIEQLGRHGRNEDGDGARSFSFTSSRGDHTEGETDTDFDPSDVDGGDGDDGEGWHKRARTKLAEKARRAVEDAEKLEAMMGGGTNGTDHRAFEPPIQAELSDESDGEEADYTTHSSIYPREHPHIPEEDEDIETDPERGTPAQRNKELSSDHTLVKRGSTGASSTHVVLPERDESEQQTATATRSSFTIFAPPPPSPPATTVQRTEQTEMASNENRSYPTPVEAFPVIFPEPKHFPESKRNSAPFRESLIALPSPTGSFPGISTSAFPNGEQSKHSSIQSAPRAKTPAPTTSQPPARASSPPAEPKKEKIHPTEWSVEDVVDWLKSKGFDQDACDKFIEQEITGDVLLDLDVNLLKTEIGIMAFGKRMRIANAIAELRRPPSIIYSDNQDQLSPSSPPMQAHTPLSPTSLSQSQSQSQSHSRNQSQSHSYHSYPGHGYSQSIQSSVGSPMMYGNGTGVNYTGVVVTESPAPEYTAPPTIRGNEGPERNGERNGMNGDHQIGLGILPTGLTPDMNGKGLKGRPTHLTLSPSDGALKSSAKADVNIPEEGDEDRGHMSEGEIAPTSMRHRLFGRSHESSSSKVNSAANSRHSKEGSSFFMPSPTIQDIPDKDKDNNKEKDKTKSKVKDKEKDKDSISLGSRHARAKKSIDGTTKGADRLSIFSGSFGGTIGKSRKPAPRYPSSTDDGLTEKGSMFSLNRLQSTGGRKSSNSQRPSTPNSPKNGFKEAKVKEPSSPITKESKERESRDPALLRKRTSSAPPIPTQIEISGVAGPLKQGQSILEQIGENDHNGWMRKKSDRYNSWKLRYFVLKGPHMYCLKSNSVTETKIKGYINIVGYKVTVDENVNPGRYGFRIEHENDKTYYFSSDEKMVVRDWMKAIMKATIGRDYTKPVISSCNIPTIPLMVAQAMNPAPRPPSPSARDATQKALRRENPNQLSSRDARVLMGLPSSTDGKDERTRLDSFFSNTHVDDDSATTGPPKSSAPPRPSREMRRGSQHRVSNPAEDALIEWANSHLPSSLQITDPTGSLCGGLALLRLAESIKGRPSSPPVPDSAFPLDATDDKLDGLFKLFDFLLDNDVKMGSVSINDVRQGKRDKIVQLIRALKAWEDKRRVIAQSFGASSVQAGGFMAPAGTGMASAGMAW